MSIIHPRSRRLARDLARFAFLASVCMFFLSAYVLIAGGRSPVSAAATSQGSVTLDPTTGNGDGTFTMSFTSGAAACPGDSNAGYRVQGFMVPVATDLAGLHFNSAGPIGGQALRDTVGNSVVAAAPDLQTANISVLPGTFTFSFNLPGDFPVGQYAIGVGCSKANVLETYWTSTITVTTDAAGGPAQITWAASPGGGSGSTTTTTGGGGTTSTTAGGGSTTTSLDGSTTTTDGSTTTTDGSTTTTGGADVSGSDVFSGGSPSAASPVTTMGQLPYTGSSPLPMVVWAIALLVFGRMAMLLGKRPKVVGDDPPE